MPPIQRVVLGKRRTVGQRAAVHRCTDLLRERHPGIPAAGTIDLRTEDQQRPLRAVDPVGEFAQPLGVGCHPMADRPDHRRTQGRLFPVVKRYRQIHRARRRLQSHGVGAHERRRHILGTLGFVSPLHPRQRQQVFIGVGQIRFAQDHFPGLLPGGDDEWGVAPIRRHQAAHRVAGAGAGVQVNQRGFAGGLREPVGHGQHRGFLQPKDIGEIVGEVLQECLLGGTRVTEHRRQAQLTKQVVGHFVDRFLICHELPTFCPVR